MKLPEKPRTEEEVIGTLRKARARGFGFESGRVLGSMCTIPHPLAREAHHAFLEANLGDPALCRGAEELEREAERMILSLLHAPPGARAAFLSGGSEANIVALSLFRAPDKDEVVLPQSAHFSFDKAARLLGMRLKRARLGAGFTVDLDDAASLITPRTACLVGIAGSTETGAVDDVPGLARIAAGARIPLHVDAAFGGFVIPFAKALGRRIPDFDLSLEEVSSVTIDPHKMGRAGIPCGVLAVRDASWLERVRIPTPYLSTDGHVTLVGTRSAAGPVSAWAAMSAMGFWGYAEQARECLANTAYLATRLAEAGIAIATPPVLNVVAIRARAPEAVRARLLERGFVVSMAPSVGGLRLVVMPHVTREAIDAFLPALEDVLRREGEIVG